MLLERQFLCILYNLKLCQTALLAFIVSVVCLWDQKHNNDPAGIQEFSKNKQVHIEPFSELWLRGGP